MVSDSSIGVPGLEYTTAGNEVATPTAAAAPRDTPTVRGLQLTLGIVLLALAAAEGVGSFGTLIHVNSPIGGTDYKGITNWRGFGWMVLILAIATVVVIVVDLMGPSASVKAVTATLFAAMAVIGGYFVVQYEWFSQRGFPTSAGWGSMLWFASGVAGLVISIVRITATARPAGTTA